jgi:hypothetical protein
MKKHCITLYQNGNKLLGSDFSIVINSKLNYLGANTIRKYFKQMEARIESLKNIKPFLNNGGLTIHYEN